MNFPLFLARRISLGSNPHKTSPAVIVATTAVALSVAVMMAAIAIVIGFKNEISSRVAGFNSHLTLLPAISSTQENQEITSNTISLTPTLSDIVASTPGVSDFGLEITIPSILKTESDFKGVYMKNLANENIRNFIADNIESGKVPDFDNPESDNKIIISRKTANSLNLKCGDKVNAYFLSSDIKVRPLKIAAIFNSHFDSYDDIYIYASLPLIQKLSETPKNEGTTIQIALNNNEQITEAYDTLFNALTQAKMNGLLYRDYRIETAISRGAGFFHWLSLLDTNVVVILSLMTVVACITLISGMLIVIADKKKFIGLLKSMGCPNSQLQKVFIYLALRITIIGLIIGNAISLIILLIQEQTHFIPLDADSYYIDFVPVSINLSYIVYLNLGILLIVYLSLILPSRMATRTAPAESMRSE